MELSMLLDYSGDPRRAADEAAALESAGLDAVWVAEAWGFDSPTIMGYLAARTERMKIGSAIVNVYSRTPALIAQTAAGLDALSGGRALLGLGASGPQVVEGWHGKPYDRPLGRTRETAEIADGWLPTLFIPEKARAVWGGPLAEGAARRDPALGPLQTVAGGLLAIGEDAAAVRDLARPQIALYVGDGGPPCLERSRELGGGRGRQEPLQRPRRRLRLRGGGPEDPGALPRRPQARRSGRRAGRVLRAHDAVRARGLRTRARGGLP
ncbi:LLM class flavin-dependent oxidoreductase [Streptomyces sp. NPDC101206]|uniref:LLM class flavin-dependent oxidoreductase n=1 Tax=Streptomyces sp. NPDC101206 TaxID=3366128 RepID=UPI0038278F3B